ncbi:MAG: hypothetical protein JWM72_1827 [Actinomycetia bacterium]|nr:hypothetical protein [Actinomycetes bacterium]
MSTIGAFSRNADASPKRGHAAPGDLAERRHRPVPAAGARGHAAPGSRRRARRAPAPTRGVVQPAVRGVVRKPTDVPVRYGQRAPTVVGVVLTEHRDASVSVSIHGTRRDDADVTGADRVGERNHVAGKRRDAGCAVAVLDEPAAVSRGVVVDDAVAVRPVRRHAVRQNHESHCQFHALPFAFAKSVRGIRAHLHHVERVSAVVLVRLRTTNLHTEITRGQRARARVQAGVTYAAVPPPRQCGCL